MVRLLCWFAHKHLEFREPELRSLAAMHGVDLSLEPVHPEPEPEPQPQPAPAQPPRPLGSSPFWLAEFPDEESAARIGRRAILLRAVLEVWGAGETYEQCLAAALDYPAEKKAGMPPSPCPRPPPGSKCSSLLGRRRLRLTQRAPAACAQPTWRRASRSTSRPSAGTSPRSSSSTASTASSRSGCAARFASRTRSRSSVRTTPRPSTPPAAHPPRD